MSGAPTWAIVPVKALDDAKQRLASVLPLHARRTLMLVMLQDVLATLRQVETLAQILVVTPDPVVAKIAESHGALVLWEDCGRGHSAAVITGFAEAHANGAPRALTIPADVPLVTPQELRAVLEASAARPSSPRLRGEGTAARLTLVPSRDGDGTNALLVSPPDAFAPSFGPGSFPRHLAQAAERGLACRTLNLPGLGLDIDGPDDLAQLMGQTRGVARYAFLAQHRLVPAGAGQP